MLGYPENPVWLELNILSASDNGLIFRTDTFFLYQYIVKFIKSMIATTKQRLIQIPRIAELVDFGD